MERLFYLCLPPHTIFLKVVTSLGTRHSFYQLWNMTTTEIAFYYSSKYQCACQTRLTQKMLGRGVLTWVHSKGFDLSDLNVKTAILTHLCHVDTFCRGNMARPFLTDQTLVKRKDLNWYQLGQDRKQNQSKPLAGFGRDP